MQKNTKINIEKLKEDMQNAKKRFLSQNEKEINEFYFLKTGGNLTDFYNFLTKLNGKKVKKYIQDQQLILFPNIYYQPQITKSKFDEINFEPSKDFEENILEEIKILKSKNAWKLYTYNEISKKPHYFETSSISFNRYFLDEMKWMAIDFSQEIRWKKKISKILAYSASYLHSQRLQMKLTEIKNHYSEAQLTATFISNSLREFWYSIISRFKGHIRYYSHFSDFFSKSLYNFIFNCPINYSTPSLFYNRSSYNSNFDQPGDSSQNEDTESLTSIKSSGKRKLSAPDNFKRKKREKFFETISTQSHIVLDTFPRSKISLDFPLPKISYLKVSLRQYQQVGVDWLFRLHEKNITGILGDDQGLGKKVQTISFFAKLIDLRLWGPHLIITSPFRLCEWESQIIKVCPSFSIYTVFEEHPNFNIKKQVFGPLGFNICISNFDCVLKNIQMFEREPWYYIILDFIRITPEFLTLNFRELMYLNSQHRLILINSTPVSSQVIPFLNLLNPISNKEILKLEYWDNNDNEFEILNRFIFRRQFSDISNQLPTCETSVIKCKLTEFQQEKYDNLISNVFNSTLASTKMTDLGLKLLGICNYPNILNPQTPLSPYVSTLKLPKISEKIFKFEPSQQLDLTFKKSCSLYLKDQLTDVRYCSNSELLNFQKSILKVLFRSKNFNEIVSNPKNVKICFCNYPCQCMFNFESLKSPLLTNALLGSSIKCFQEYKLEFKKRLNQSIQFGLGSAAPIHKPNINERALKIFTIDSEPKLYDDILNSTIKNFLNKIDISRLFVNIPFAISFDKTENIQLKDFSKSISKHPRILFDDFRDSDARCGKLQYLTSLSKDFRTDDKILIFTHSEEMVEILHRFLTRFGYKTYSIDSQTSFKDCLLILELFNEDLSAKYLVLPSLPFISQLTTPNVNIVIIYEGYFNITKGSFIDQILKKIKQNRQVYVYRFVTLNSIEERLLNLFNKKSYGNINLSDKESIESAISILIFEKYKKLFFNEKEHDYIFDDKDSSIQKVKFKQDFLKVSSDHPKFKPIELYVIRNAFLIEDKNIAHKRAITHQKNLETWKSIQSLTEEISHLAQAKDIPDDSKYFYEVPIIEESEKI